MFTKLNKNILKWIILIKIYIYIYIYIYIKMLLNRKKIETKNAFNLKND
ncbi:MAG: hypothetical protein N7Q72_03345 [Spiroplasma sp. Tabriz.8]|nr:hypothetical protein [Spiroplasma sp. Tabriz.8]